MPDTSTRLRALLAAASLLLVSCAPGGDGGSPATSAPAPADPGAVIDPGDGGNYAPSIDPADFTAVVDNPYMPLPPGAKWHYEGLVDGEPEIVDVEVTSERRQVMGIPAVVVRDTVVDEDGELIEDTFDWYAQDRDGNVWYLGEQTKEYDAGKVVSTAGSWEAGKDGALPGIVMKAAPAAGDAYRQEFSKGEAEDMAEVVRTGQTTATRTRRYERVVVIREWTPLEPEVVEEKSYAPGVGFVLQVHTAGGSGRLELVRSTPGSR